MMCEETEGSPMSQLIRLSMVMVVAVAVIAVGCGDEDELHPGWEQSVSPEGPWEMNDAVVYYDEGFEDLIVVRSTLDDEEKPQLDVERHETGPEPVEFEVSADGTELYVLNAGELPGEESLSIFEIDAEDVERQDVDLTDFYDEITPDPEGDYVLLGNSGDGDVVSQPLRALGIVDLNMLEPEVNTVNLTQARAEDPVFLPPFEMDGETERLAVVTATNWISLVDLEAGDADPHDRSVPLTLSEADEVEPTDFVFQRPTGANPDRASLFVLDDRSDDITQVSLQRPVAAGAQHRLDLSINQLAAGDSPGAVEVVELEEAGQRLVVLDDQSPEFSLVDIDSGESATFELPMADAGDGMHAFTKRIHEGGEEYLRPRVLVYSRNSELISIIRPEAIAVGSDTPTLGDSVDQIRLESTPSEVIVDDDNERAVVLHAGGNDGFTILDLENNRDIPWWGENLGEVVLDDGVAYARFANSPHISRVDLVAGSSHDSEIPDVPEELFVEPGGDTVLVQHAGDSGRFTSVPEQAVAEPQGGLFDEARLFEQVFFRDVLDRPVTEDEADD